MIKKLISEFLEKYGVKSFDGDNVELMMDDHTFIQYEEVGYYLPENNSNFNEDDEFILILLNQIYCL